MKFDVLITHIAGGTKAKNIIARHLAHDPSISLQKALSLLENPPVVYMTGLLKEDAQYQVRLLEKIQVTAKLVEVQLGPLIPHPVAPFTPEHIAAPPAAPPPQPAQPPQPLRPAPRPVEWPAPEAPRAFPAGTAGPEGTGLSAKSKIIIAVAGAALVVIVAVLALNGTFNWGHVFTLDWSKAGLVSGESATKKPSLEKGTPLHGKRDSADRKNRPGENPDIDSAADRDDATEEQKNNAEACVDSGKTAPDISRAISFYQLAIAFNKRNVNAWYALHDAYLTAQMGKEAENAAAMMRRLFGDNIFSVAKIVEPFGETRSMSLTRDGIYRVEYRSPESNPQKALAGTYLLARALKNSCLCSALSLYAAAPGGKGVLVYIRTESFPASFDEYKTSANITYLK
jgi:hypothetical protein